MTALMLACQNGHTEIAALLIEKGADKEAKDNLGWTPLMAAACQNGHTEIAALLIDKGAHKEAKDNNGWTALMIACQNRR